MIKLIYVFALIAFTLVSCDNNDNLQSSYQIAIEKIKQNAKEISLSHDSLVLKMIKIEKQKVKQKIKSTDNEGINLNLTEICDVIEEATNVRPIVLGNISPEKQKSKSSNTDKNLSINFDVDKLDIADYATSDMMAKYLKQIDIIKQDSAIAIAEKLDLISEIQTKILKDPNATLVEIEIFYNITEILKGSLILWNSENSQSKAKQNISGIYYAKPLTQWSFWAKLGFVAGADAIGGVLGTFTGGIVTVGGVSIYVPSGPTGTVAGAAALSFIASKMVGW